MKRAVTKLDELKFVHNTLDTVYQSSLKHNLTSSKRKIFEKHLMYLKSQIEFYEDMDTYSYAQETLEEIDDDR